MDTVRSLVYYPKEKIIILRTIIADTKTTNFVQNTFTDQETGDVDDDIPQNFIDSLDDISTNISYADEEEVAGSVCDLCCKETECVGDLKCVNAAKQGCNLEKKRGSWHLPRRKQSYALFPFNSHGLGRTYK